MSSSHELAWRVGGHAKHRRPCAGRLTPDGATDAFNHSIRRHGADPAVRLPLHEGRVRCKWAPGQHQAGSRRQAGTSGGGPCQHALQQPSRGLLAANAPTSGVTGVGEPAGAAGARAGCRRALGRQLKLLPLLLMYAVTSSNVFMAPARPAVPSALAPSQQSGSRSSHKLAKPPCSVRSLARSHPHRVQGARGPPSQISAASHR